VSVPSLAELKLGAVVNFGTDHGVPIAWRVLDKNSSSCLLITDRVLTSGSFRADSKAVDFDDYLASDVRVWLKNTFIPSSFSTEQRAVLKTSVSNTEYAFVLSAHEVVDYMPTTASRQSAPSAWASANVGYSGAPLATSGGYASWWLRETENFPAGGHVHRINNAGQDVHADPTATDVGIRPCIKLDVTKLPAN
jgi:hypothetical protein